MTEDFFNEVAIADELLELIPSLLRQLRADIPRPAEGEEAQPEWQDVSALRATTGQVRLLRILSVQERSTMQDLAEQLDVAPPTVTAMVKRLLTQGFVERLRDEQDWRLVWISATKRGQRAVALYDQFRRTNLLCRLAQLDQEELKHLHAALPVLRHIIEVQYDNHD